MAVVTQAGDRRDFLRLGLLSLASAAIGCSAATPKPPEQSGAKPLPDLEIAALTDLLTAVRMRWLVLARPEQLMSTAWLKPSLGRVLRDERLDLLARATGIDLRSVPELALANYSGRGEGDDDVTAYFVRHRRPQLVVERKFRDRLTSNAKRMVSGHQLIGMWGNIGTRPHGFAAIGPDVVGYQYGGTRKRGPARLALLYADKKLSKVPTALANPELLPLRAKLASAPMVALLPGPFEGDLAKGARGLLGGATALCAALSPTEQHALQLDILLGGSYLADRAQAIELLRAAWVDLVVSDLGHLLGLHAPIQPLRVDVDANALSLRVDLDPNTLCAGLAAATSDSIRDIMK